MEKLSAIMIIPVIFGIATAVLILAVSAQNAVPDSKATYFFAPVSGGGCQIESVYETGKSAHFNFEAKYEDGAPTGNLHLIDHGDASPPKLKVHSESIDTLEISGKNATFSGTARVNDESGYNFTVYVKDNGVPGKDRDFFEINIKDPEGSEYYSASGKLKGGNIRVYGSGDLPTTNLSIEFDASKSYDPDGYIKVYRWDFENDSIWDIEGNVVKVTHSYNVSGNYNVTLQIEDNNGAKSNTTINVTINDEGEEEGISDSLMWKGNHTFGLFDDMVPIPIGRFQPIIATASEIKNNLDENVNVTVELRVDGVLLNWNTTTLGPYQKLDIPVFALWVPMSSGMHFVSLRVRDVNDWKYSWVGITNDLTAEVTTFIEKVK